MAIEDMNVKNECHIGFGFKPMNIVLGVCDCRTTTWAEVAVDRWSNDHVIARVFNPIVVTTMKIPFQDEEGGGHVIVSMRHNRSVLVQCKDLMAEDQLGWQPFYFWQSRLQTQFAPFLWVHIFRELVKIQKSQQLGQVDRLVKLLDFFLPLKLLKFLAL